MVRKFKYHEQKLLKKVDFLNWKQTSNLREIKVLRRYHIQDRDDYHKYNRLCGLIKSYAHRLSLLPPSSPFRLTHEPALLAKLYDMGLINAEPGASALSAVEAKVGVAGVCRRRLGVVMCRVGMVGSVRDAVRAMEDFVTWVDTSKVRRTVMEYNDELDDFDLL